MGSIYHLGSINLLSAHIGDIGVLNLIGDIVVSTLPNIGMPAFPNVAVSTLILND